MSALKSELKFLAPLFTYPGDEYGTAVENAMDCASAAAPALSDFANAIRKLSLSDLQALYTSTFDLQPQCSLDVGWHLFGEDYERGKFLARMRRELQAHNIPESSELPDHLSHTLLLLARMEPARAEDFGAAVVAPALERMLGSIPAANAFGHLIRAAQQLIRLHFHPASEAASRQLKELCYEPQRH